MAAHALEVRFLPRRGLMRGCGMLFEIGRPVEAI